MEGYRSIETSPRNQFEDMSGRRERITITEKIPGYCLRKEALDTLAFVQSPLKKGGDVEHNSH